MTYYCPKCDKMVDAALHDCTSVGIMDTSNANFGDTKKGYTVPRDSVHTKEIWNEALEAALIANARVGGTIEADEAIRKLKK